MNWLVTTPNVLGESILVVGIGRHEVVQECSRTGTDRVAPMRSVALKSLEMVASRFQNPKPRREPAPPEFVSCAENRAAEFVVDRAGIREHVEAGGSGCAGAEPRGLDVVVGAVSASEGRQSGAPVRSSRSGRSRFRRSLRHWRIVESRSGRPERAVNNGAIVHPPRMRPATPFWLLKNGD